LASRSTAANGFGAGYRAGRLAAFQCRLATDFARTVESVQRVIKMPAHTVEGEPAAPPRDVSKAGFVSVSEGQRQRLFGNGRQRAAFL
jgi:hypothetical protein